MPFGQSFAIRMGILGTCNALGMPPQVSSQTARVIGWLAAHATFDYHSQITYEGILSTMSEENLRQVIIKAASDFTSPRSVPLNEAISSAVNSVPS